MLPILKKHGVIPMALVTLVLLMLFHSLRANLSDTYKQSEKSVSNKAAVCINTASPDDISKVLKENNYVKNETDAHFVAQILHQRIKENGPLVSLFDIRKNAYRALIKEVEESKSETYKSLYHQMCDELEQADSTFLHSSNNGSNVTIDSSLNGKIKVSIWEKDKSANWLKSAIKLDKKPCSNVYVRLNEHSLNNPEGLTIAYLRTDDKGKGSFEGLDKSKSYSVLPIAAGCKFGNAQGTIHSTLKTSDDNKFQFEQNAITVPLLSESTLGKIREDNKLIVRPLDEYLGGLSSRFLGVVLFWWCFFIIMPFFKRPVDSMLTSALLGLTGLCCLIMHSMNNPLTDAPLGNETTQGIMIGCAVIVIVQFLNLTHFYQNKYKIHFDVVEQFGEWLCKPFKKKMAPFVQRLKSDNAATKLFNLIAILVLYIPFLLLSIFSKLKGKESGIQKGTGYLIIAILITILLFTPLGTGVGGMKVNLNLLGIKFQPSEIAKYLFVIFMAAFFCQNANKIIALDSIGKARLFRKKLKNLLVLIIGFGVLMVLYVFLQDLGPAMVIIFTFIILYSIIKSKDKIDKNIRLQDIISCDFAILCIGVITFLLAIYVGKMVGAPGITCIAWFVVWIGIGKSRFKQIHETSILFNLVLSAFIFGSSLKDVPINFISNIGERLHDRSAMCTNTWGELGLNGTETEATTNSQVADGLWGLATGGWGGQGLSHGESSLIPAFNTDMILESIGTQIGFTGLAFVLLLYFFLFRRSLVVGYRSNHPFTFYLCVGIAIVTGVQLAIIALGSTGVIPLTGITVPLLSYGKVSMILNLFAFGLVLTVSSHNKVASANDQAVRKYNNSMSLLTYSFLSIILVIGATFFYYQWIDRNNTLIRPVLAKNATGITSLNYNPRISALVGKMRIGNIYDRNGILLATSNKDELKKYTKKYEECNLISDFDGKRQRYYPFAEHLFFMVGDLNSKLFFSGINRGLLAEKQFLDSLRGYNNILKDQNGNKQYVNITQTDVFVSRFLDEKISQKTSEQIALRDYSALIPYLKAGVNSSRVKDYNNDDENIFSMGKIKPKDINLSVDAVLQTKLQNNIRNFVLHDQTLGKWKKVRVSAVVLDASTGEVLTSANYPLPNLDNLAEQANVVYKDKEIAEAYTDMDLGLFYPTPPGSTAKVMSALSSFMKDGEKAANYTYPIRYYEKPTEGAADVFTQTKDNNHVTMDEAITWSSNIYFIKLVNENNLYGELGRLYSNVGIQIDGLAPYGLLYHKPSSSWSNKYKDITAGATDYYFGLKNKKGQNRLAGHRAFWLAWGQNPMTATPLAMAKVSAIVANKGTLPEVRFVKGRSSKNQFAISNKGIEHLQSYMRHEAKEHTTFTINNYNAGGKTGTVVRGTGVYKNRKEQTVNDAWYICFCDKGAGKGKIAIALRIERAHASSTKAKQMMRDVVLRTLDEMGYI